MSKYTIDGPLVFVDLETTGLDPRTNRILEIGILIADPHTLDVMGTFEQVLHHRRCTYSELVSLYGQTVADMHTENGLWDECAENNMYNPTMKVLEFLSTYNRGKQVPICGDSVQFDRGFLKECFPDIEGFFNHRNFDVSTLRMYYETFHTPLNFKYGWSSANKHRALSDCWASLADLLYATAREVYP